MITSFVLRRGDSEYLRPVPIRHAVIAGWTGRDGRLVDQHIQELKQIGVAPPSSTPLFYRVAASRLTVDDEIEVCGDNSSGEVETLLVGFEGTLWLGVGSDHTDRSVEGYSVPVSKQLCDKPVALELWAFEEIADHWDSLIIRSWLVTAEGRELYQEGGTNSLLPPSELIQKYAGGPLPDETAMFCGTVPAKGGVRSSERFAFELYDPVLRRAMSHEYAVRVLPIVT